MRKYLNLRAIIALGIAITFLANTLGPLPTARADEFLLPAPGQMVYLSPAFSPAVLKGIKLDAHNPFRFHFFVDKGDSKSNQEELKIESAKLIKYFLASLTIPEKNLWVNLSPYEKDRIVPQEFGQTEMGRDLLAQDYLLKQITASLVYPESRLGKAFWQKVYAQAKVKYGTTNIPINTFNKVWIVPDRSVVYENGGTAFVLENHLKVMSEQDYLSLEKHASISNGNALGAQVVREIVIPQLTKEVNEGKNFSPLRQVFYSLILATWYKKKIKDSILNKVYSDQNRIGGVNVSAQDKDKIYQEYLQAFKKGVYNYIKEDPDPLTDQTIPRKYFSGGVNARVNLAMLGPKQVSPADLATLANEQMDDVSGDLTMTHQDLPLPAADAARQINDELTSGELDQFYNMGTGNFNLPILQKIVQQVARGTAKELGLVYKDQFDLIITGGSRYLMTSRRKDVDLMVKLPINITQRVDISGIIEQKFSEILASIKARMLMFAENDISRKDPIIIFPFRAPVTTRTPQGVKYLAFELFYPPFLGKKRTYSPEEYILNWLSSNVPGYTKKSALKVIATLPDFFVDTACRDLIAALYFLGNKEQWDLLRRRYLALDEHDAAGKGRLLAALQDVIPHQMVEQLQDPREHPGLLGTIKERLDQPLFDGDAAMHAVSKKDLPFDQRSVDVFSHDFNQVWQAILPIRDIVNANIIYGVFHFNFPKKTFSYAFDIRASRKVSHLELGKKLDIGPDDVYVSVTLTAYSQHAILVLQPKEVAAAVPEEEYIKDYMAAIHLMGAVYKKEDWVVSPEVISMLDRITKKKFKNHEKLPELFEMVQKDPFINGLFNKAMLITKRETLPDVEMPADKELTSGELDKFYNIDTGSFNLPILQKIVEQVAQRTAEKLNLKYKDQFDLIITGGTRYLMSGRRKDIDLAVKLPVATKHTRKEITSILEEEFKSFLIFTNGSKASFKNKMIQNDDLSILFPFKAHVTPATPEGTYYLKFELLYPPYTAKKRTYSIEKSILSWLSIFVPVSMKRSILKVRDPIYGSLSTACKGLIASLYYLGDQEQWEIMRRRFLALDDHDDAGMGELLAALQAVIPRQLVGQLQDPREHPGLLAIIKERLNQTLFDGDAAMNAILNESQPGSAIKQDEFESAWEALLETANKHERNGGTSEEWSDNDSIAAVRILSHEGAQVRIVRTPRHSAHYQIWYLENPASNWVRVGDPRSAFLGRADIPDDGGLEFFVNNGILHMEKTYILSDFQKLGICTAYLDWVINYAAKHGLSIELRGRNPYVIRQIMRLEDSAHVDHIKWKSIGGSGPYVIRPEKILFNENNPTLVYKDKEKTVFRAVFTDKQGQKRILIQDGLGNPIEGFDYGEGKEVSFKIGDDTYRLRESDGYLAEIKKNEEDWHFMNYNTFTIVMTIFTKRSSPARLAPMATMDQAVSPDAAMVDSLSTKPGDILAFLSPKMKILDPNRLYELERRGELYGYERKRALAIVKKFDMFSVHGDIIYDLRTGKGILITGASKLGKSNISMRLIKDPRFTVRSDDCVIAYFDEHGVLQASSSTFPNEPPTRRPREGPEEEYARAEDLKPGFIPIGTIIHLSFDQNIPTFQVVRGKLDDRFNDDEPDLRMTESKAERIKRSNISGINVLIPAYKNRDYDALTAEIIKILSADPAMNAIVSMVSQIESRIERGRFLSSDYARLAYWHWAIQLHPGLADFPPEPDQQSKLKDQMTELIPRLNKPFGLSLGNSLFLTTADAWERLQNPREKDKMLIVTTENNFWLFNIATLTVNEHDGTLEANPIDPQTLQQRKERIKVNLEPRMTFKFLPADEAMGIAAHEVKFLGSISYGLKDIKEYLARFNTEKMSKPDGHAMGAIEELKERASEIAIRTLANFTDDTFRGNREEILNHLKTIYGMALENAIDSFLQRSETSQFQADLEKLRVLFYVYRIPSSRKDQYDKIGLRVINNGVSLYAAETTEDKMRLRQAAQPGQYIRSGGAGAGINNYTKDAALQLSPLGAGPEIILSDRQELLGGQIQGAVLDVIIPVRKDEAMVAAKGRREGGINLNPAQMSMQVKDEGTEFKFDLYGPSIDAAQVTGATFTIRTMTPVTDLPELLGLHH